jgi:hypothetical protein
MYFIGKSHKNISALEQILLALHLINLSSLLQITDLKHVSMGVSLERLMGMGIAVTPQRQHIAETEFAEIHYLPLVRGIYEYILHTLPLW